MDRAFPNHYGDGKKHSGLPHLKNLNHLIKFTLTRSKVTLKTKEHKDKQILDELQGKTLHVLQNIQKHNTFLKIKGVVI